METRQEEASIVHNVGRLETMENSILNARLDLGCRTECWAILAGQYSLDLGNTGQRFSTQDDAN